MAISVVESGNLEAPTLVCLPGMIGGPSDFKKINAGLEDHFHLLVVDINTNTRDEGIKGLKEESVENINYREVAREISEHLLERFPEKQVYLVGLSIGGKIAYHFIADHPEKFLGGVITDMTPGLMEHTDLFQNVIRTVESMNLNQDWNGIKSELNDKIADRNFRVLIKSQIFFPTPGAAAEWRNGMDGLERLLKRSSTDELWAQLKEAEAFLTENKRMLKILKAERMSGIAACDEKRLRELKFVSIETISNATHFIHINEVERLRGGILSLL